MIEKLIGVALYLAALLLIGVVASKRMNDLRDYFVGGKSLSYWIVAFSSRATGESAWLLLGLTGMGATMGVQAFWVVIGETIGVTLAWLWMSTRFKNLTDRYDSVTMPDYLESRFRDTGHLLRGAAAIALVVFVTIYVSAQIDATGKAFETFLAWNYFAGVFVGFAVVLIYIMSGGFVAVAWSDTFQGALMLIGLVALPLFGLVHVGGPSALIDGLAAQDAALTTFSFGSDLESIFATLSFCMIGLGFLGSPQIFVRFISLRSPDEIKKGAFVAILFTILSDGGAVLTGMVGRQILVGASDTVSLLGESGQDVLPLLVDAIVPLSLAGIFIAIVLSAIMSTIDSLLVVAASAVVRDWYQKIKRPDVSDEELLSLSRKVTFGLAAVALTISLVVAVTTPDRTIFWFTIFGWSGISATFCPVMILSLFWSRMTAKGALASMVSGFACVPLFKFVVPTLGEVGALLEKLSELPPSFLIAFLAGIVVSLLDKNGALDVGDELSDAG